MQSTENINQKNLIGLISLEDVEAIDADLAYFEDFTHGSDGMKITKMRKLLQGLKQLDLNPRAIEAQVKSATDTYELNGWEQQGYRQALKDLIKK